MKKTHIILTSLLAIVLLLVACNDDTNQENNNANAGQQTNENQTEENDTSNFKENEPDSDMTPDQNQNANESESSQANNTSNSSDNNEENPLSTYTTQEIEYARVWLELGDNQTIDTLYAQQIPAGEPLNPDDETSLDYPEDVVQLSGERLIDGVITYSSNGDGTVNIYNVPKRWDGENPAGADFYQNIIDETTQQSIDPGEDDQVEDLIQKLEIEE